MVKPVLRISAVAAFLYAALAATIYFAQENILFHFAPVPENHTYKFRASHEDVWVDNEDGRLHGILFRTDTMNPRGVVVYYKGNAGNVSWSEVIAEPFLSMGFDVLSMDYRGFGKSRGPLSEARLLHDAELWFDWANEAYEGRDVRVLGYSLGTTFASHVSATRGVEDMILFAPMKSVVDVAARRYPYIPSFLAEYPLRSDLKLANSDARIVIYHGTNDRIIDFASGHALSDVLGPDDSFVAIEGGTHYDLPWRKDVRRDIAARWGLKTASNASNDRVLSR